MADDYTDIEKTDFGKKAAGPVGWMDDRLGLAAASNKLMPLRKVFPEHWSFMLGEIALWSFIVLLLSGVFLTFWFQPSMAEVVYDGSYEPLRGLEMSQAYASTLDISFDIRGGLLMRQIHHWAAAIFVAAMIVHMLRIFFTGAYRKPREVNWLIGLGLFRSRSSRASPATRSRTTCCPAPASASSTASSGRSRWWAPTSSSSSSAASSPATSSSRACTSRTSC